MKSIRRWVRNFFGFSRTEINGFLILIPLMFVLIVSEPLYHRYVARRPFEPDTNVNLDSLISVWNVPESISPPPRLFRFNPNTASREDLMSLGFSENLATRIAAYRTKGGVFRKKDDLLKIYGLDSALYEQLYEYVDLPADRADYQRATPLADAVRSERKRSVNRNKSELRFDINTADTAMLKSVYGIGSRLSARIVRFRDALGGYVIPEQLYEVYGIDSATVNRLLKVCFITEGFIPKKININTATPETLAEHPYISIRLARLLVSYRFQHGDFPDVNDIKKLSAFQTGEVNKLLPYLTVE